MKDFIKRFKKNPKHFLLIWLTSPFIYGLLIPTILVDIMMTLFQFVCFPVYKVPKVRRRDYVIIDRGKLTYLNFFQKVNCLYCGYANGVAGYASEIAARTEWFWCPIKHEKAIPRPHEYYDKFMEYGEAEGFREKYREARRQCRACEDPCGIETAAVREKV